MKKMFFFLTCCFILCGCSKEINGYEITNLKATPYSDDAYYIGGDIKNVNTEECEVVNIWLKLLGDGDLEDTTCITVDSPKKGESDYFYEKIHTELSSFKIIVNDVYCND